MAAVSDENVRISKEGGTVKHGAQEANAWHSGVAAVVTELASKQVQPITCCVWGSDHEVWFMYGIAKLRETLSFSHSVGQSVRAVSQVGTSHRPHGLRLHPAEPSFRSLRVLRWVEWTWCCTCGPV